MSEEELTKKANDFEEEHGWSPDYGYEVFEEAIDENPMVKHKYELHVICPHCEKECDVPIYVTTDDKNINDMLSLLCSYGARGRKKEKNENKEITVHPGELESARDDLQRAIQLRNVSSVALADIRDSWSKKDADNKN